MRESSIVLCSLNMARMYCASIGPITASMPLAYMSSDANLALTPFQSGFRQNLEWSAATWLLATGAAPAAPRKLPRTSASAALALPGPCAAAAAASRLLQSTLLLSWICSRAVFTSLNKLRMLPLYFALSLYHSGA